MKSIAKIDLPPTPIVQEWSSRPLVDYLGDHASTMELFWFKGTLQGGVGTIEWDIPTLDETEHIGIWTENGELTDYDGLFSLPDEAVALLRQVGIIVPDEFEDKGE